MGAKRTVCYMKQSSLAETLRVLRAREGLTLVEASEKIGINRQTLRELELGARNPYYPTLEKIAQGYGLTVEELMVPYHEHEPEGEPVGAGKAKAPQAGQSEEGRIHPGDDVVHRLAEACRDLTDEIRRVREAPAEELRSRRLAELDAELKEAQAELASALYRGGPPAGLTEFGGKAIDRQRQQKAQHGAEEAGSEAG